MFGVISSLLLLGSIWQLPDQLAPPLAGGPKTSQKTEITESSESYSAEILKQKLNVPGLSDLSFMFAAPPELFKPLPKPDLGQQSGASWLMGQWENTIWESFHPFNERHLAVKLSGSARAPQIGSPQCCRLSMKSSEFSTAWLNVLTLRWQSSTTFKCEVSKDGKTREVAESLPPGSKANPCPCLEGVLPFEISGEGSCRLELGLGSWKCILFERTGKPFRETVKVTLKLCRTKNWYSAKMEYANRIIETGWRAAEATALQGTASLNVIQSSPNEWFTVTWSKRAAPFTEANGKSSKVILEPY